MGCGGVDNMDMDVDVNVESAHNSLYFLFKYDVLLLTFSILSFENHG
jgi:hypothetical protein